MPNGTAEPCQEEEFNFPAMEKVHRDLGGRRWVPAAIKESARLRGTPRAARPSARLFNLHLHPELPQETHNLIYTLFGANWAYLDKSTETWWRRQLGASFKQFHQILFPGFCLKPLFKGPWDTRFGFDLFFPQFACQCSQGSQWLQAREVEAAQHRPTSTLRSLTASQDTAVGAFNSRRARGEVDCLPSPALPLLKEKGLGFISCCQSFSLPRCLRHALTVVSVNSRSRRALS